MKTYYCHKCEAKKKMDNWGRSNPDSYCYCTPNTPTMMTPVSFKKMRDYSKILKKLTH